MKNYQKDWLLEAVSQPVMLYFLIAYLVPVLIVLFLHNSGYRQASARILAGCGIVWILVSGMIADVSRDAVIVGALAIQLVTACLAFLSIKPDREWTFRIAVSLAFMTTLAFAFVLFEDFPLHEPTVFHSPCSMEKGCVD